MGTKKILNKDVSNVVEESLAGYLMAYRKYYKKVGEYNAFTYKGHRKDKVALVIGGGSGHEPLFTGDVYKRQVLERERYCIQN